MNTVCWSDAGGKSLAVVSPPWLVPDSGRSATRCPLLWAIALGSTEAVARRFVTDVVEYVCVTTESALFCASEEKNTSAAPGAGTGIVQVLAVWSHEISLMISWPMRRPSTSKRGPNVWRTFRGEIKRNEREAYLVSPEDLLLLRNGRRGQIPVASVALNEVWQSDMN